MSRQAARLTLIYGFSGQPACSVLMRSNFGA
nr:MAG TPA: hypothetical protein [Caudoviricetes sp.]